MNRHALLLTAALLPLSLADEPAAAATPPAPAAEAQAACPLPGKFGGERPAPDAEEDGDGAAGDNSFTIEADPALSEAEQQAVRDYVMQSLLRQAQMLQAEFSAPRNTTYGTNHRNSLAILQTVPTDKLPADYQAYVQACIREMERGSKALGAIADKPIFPVERSREEEQVIFEAQLELAERLDALAEEYPQPAEYIGMSALSRAFDRLTKRPSFHEAVVNAAIRLEGEEEAMTQFALITAQLMEAEIRYLLGEDVDAPSRPKPAMSEEYIRATYQTALGLMTESIGLLKGITDTASADAACARLAEIDDALENMSRQNEAYATPDDEQLKKVLGDREQEQDELENAYEGEKKRLEEAAFYHSTALRAFFKECLFL